MMDAMKHLNDFNPIDSEGDEVESSHLQLDSIPSDSQSEEVVESINLHSDTSSAEAQSVVGEILVNGDAQVVESVIPLHLGSSSSEVQSVVGEILVNGDAQVVESVIPLHLGSSSSEVQSVVGEILVNGDAQVVDDHASNSGQCSYDPQVAYVENAQVVDNHTSNSGQYSFDSQGAYQYVAPIHLHLDSSSSEAQSVAGEILVNGDAQGVHDHTSNSSGQYSFDPQVAYVGPLSSDSSNTLTYNGATYYSYKAFARDFCRDFMQEKQMDGVAPRSDDGDDGPQFSDSMVFATGGSHTVINPHNGLPWRKGANLCRPYMDEGCCQFGTACIFHHPWPPREDSS